MDGVILFALVVVYFVISYGQSEKRTKADLQGYQNERAS